LKKMGSNPEHMLYILGMDTDDDGPPDFPSGPPTPDPAGGLNNVEDLINMIMQLQETVQNLQHQNHDSELQDQMAAAQARGVMPTPPPWAPPGVAPRIIHRVRMPPPIVNINATELGAAITHAVATSTGTTSNMRPNSKGT
jgi:hypothetical protein